MSEWKKKKVLLLPKADRSTANFTPLRLIKRSREGQSFRQASPKPDANQRSRGPHVSTKNIEKNFYVSKINQTKHFIDELSVVHVVYEIKMLFSF